MVAGLGSAVAAGIVATSRSPAARCALYRAYPNGAFCVPGEPTRFDPIGQLERVATEAGLDSAVLPVSVDASGRWHAGTLDLTDAGTRLRYVFADGTGHSTEVLLEVETFRVNPAPPVPVEELGDLPACTGPQEWTRARREHLHHTPEIASFTYRANAISWSFESDSQKFTAEATSWCSRYDQARHKDVAGCYQAHHRSGLIWDFARFVPPSGPILRAPSSRSVPPLLSSVVAAHYARYYGEPIDLSDIPQWPDVDAPAIWVHVRGSARFDLEPVPGRFDPQVKFSEIRQARPSTAAACLAPRARLPRARPPLSRLLFTVEDTSLRPCTTLSLAELLQDAGYTVWPHASHDIPADLTIWVTETGNDLPRLRLALLNRDAEHLNDPPLAETTVDQSTPLTPARLEEAMAKLVNSEGLAEHLSRRPAGHADRVKVGAHADQRRNACEFSRRSEGLVRDRIAWGRRSKAQRRGVRVP